MPKIEGRHIFEFFFFYLKKKVVIETKIYMDWVWYVEVKKFEITQP